MMAPWFRLAGAVLAGSLLGFPVGAPAQTLPAPARQPFPKSVPSPAPAAQAPIAPSVQKPVSKAADTDDTVVARIGTTDVGADEVRAFVAGLGAREQAAIARDPALMSQAIRSMLANQLVLKEALEKKWEQRAAVAAQLQQLRNNAVVETYLQSISAPAAGFPSDAEIEKAYEANKSAFLVPRQFQIAQVFVALARDADKPAEEAARKKLGDVQARMKQPGADFAAVAQSLSDDAETSARGGEIGWIAEAQLRPEIKAQVVGMAKNASSDPVRLDDGWHIVRLIDTKAAYTRPLADVRDALAQQLRAQRADANRRAYLAKLLEQTPPAINEIALMKALGVSGQAAGR